MENFNNFYLASKIKVIAALDFQEMTKSGRWYLEEVLGFACF